MPSSESDKVKWIDLGNGAYTVSQEDLQKLIKQGNDLFKSIQANQNRINGQIGSGDPIKPTTTSSEGAVIACVVAVVLVLSMFVAIVMHHLKNSSEDGEERNRQSNRTVPSSRHYASYQNNAIPTSQTVTTEMQMQRNAASGVSSAEIAHEILSPRLAWIPSESQSNEYNGQENTVLTDIIAHDPPPPYECPPPDYQTATK